jgi:hypothetical protein
MAQENGIATPSADEIARDLRTLALVDRVIGLEAEVARLSSTTTAPTGARDEVARLEGELRAVYGSRTWRVGTAVLRPVRALRRGGRS